MPLFLLLLFQNKHPSLPSRSPSSSLITSSLLPTASPLSLTATTLSVDFVANSFWCQELLTSHFLSNTFFVSSSCWWVCPLSEFHLQLFVLIDLPAGYIDIFDPTPPNPFGTCASPGQPSGSCHRDSLPSRRALTGKLGIVDFPGFLHQFFNLFHPAIHLRRFTLLFRPIPLTHISNPSFKLIYPSTLLSDIQYNYHSPISLGQCPQQPR